MQVQGSEQALRQEGDVLRGYQQRLASEGLELQRGSIDLLHAKERLELAEETAQARYDLAENHLRRSGERLLQEEAGHVRANLHAAEELSEVRQRHAVLVEVVLDPTCERESSLYYMFHGILTVYL